jgi:hypothetical protein
MTRRTKSSRLTAGLGLRRSFSTSSAATYSTSWSTRTRNATLANESSSFSAATYVYLVPFVEDEKLIFLKTIIPSRKATKEYLGEEPDHDEA